MTTHHLARSISRGMIIGSFTLVLLIMPASSTYIVPPVSSVRPISSPLLLPPAPDIPVNDERVPAPLIGARGAYVVDIGSGIPLYEREATTQFFPASTTKMMTALVGRKEFQLDDILTVKSLVTEGHIIGIRPGQRFRFEDLLYAALVHSANDAATAIADNDPDGRESFIKKMNDMSASLYLTGTHFTNPVGFDDPSHVSTPKDLAKIAIALLQDPVLTKISGTKGITISDVTYSSFYPLVNVNDLLGKIPGMSGIKTGYTDAAGGILVSHVQRGNRSVLFVVVKSDDRFGDTSLLVDWVFQHFHWHPASEVIPDTF